MAKMPAYLQQAVKHVEYWAPRLRLDHWEIEVVAAPDDYDGYASATFNANCLRVSIEVSDPTSAPDNFSAQCNDLEATIVHELIHVRWAEVTAALDGKEHYSLEQATEMTALALVAARRGIHPRKLAAQKVGIKMSKAHPGFKAVQGKIERKEHVSAAVAGAILASHTRHAGRKAKAANPKLKKVRGK